MKVFVLYYSYEDYDYSEPEIIGVYSSLQKLKKEIEKRIKEQNEYYRLYQENEDINIEIAKKWAIENDKFIREFPYQKLSKHILVLNVRYYDKIKQSNSTGWLDYFDLENIKEWPKWVDFNVIRPYETLYHKEYFKIKEIEVE